MGNESEGGRKTGLKLDFAELSRLAREDPEGFERRRREILEQSIAEAPEALRQRLRGLQWRADRIREQAKTPMAACLRFSEMMWTAVVGERGLLESLQTLTQAADTPPEARENATILEFPTGGRDSNRQ